MNPVTASTGISLVTAMRYTVSNKGNSSSHPFCLNTE